jgi:hypothetical protein
MTVTTLPTWSTVSTEYSRATQMAVQTVEAFAAIGDMLIKLKANAKHGEFGKKCAEAFGKNQIRTGSSEIDDANRQAQKYMRLAENRNAWLPHNPQSMNEAMKMLPAKRAAQKPSAVTHTNPNTGAAIPKKDKLKGYVSRLQEAGLINSTAGSASRNKVYDQVASLAGLEKLPRAAQMTQDQSVAIDAAITTLVAKQSAKSVASEPLPELSETAQQKLDRAIKISLAKLQAEYEAAVQAEADKRVPEYIEQLKKSREKFVQDSTDFYTRMKGLTVLITEAEYKSLLSFCHPDKHTDPEMKTRANRVFDIVRQLNPYIEAGKPRRVA